jgi:hypothetical protein
MQVKIFHGKVREVESSINEWLHENPAIKIIQMTQSESGDSSDWSMVVTLLFEFI